ncbi:hypothetical protein [Raoultibacter phocaeensis]|uniref:hypothetical protein n=1 Tax=Raoultibacter phocaeensis TaxID=2479841 RepID=UPI0015D58D98|nr:hypothetical protein [Raoultibacter phocaeensis]
MGKALTGRAARSVLSVALAFALVTTSVPLAIADEGASGANDAAQAEASEAQGAKKPETTLPADCISEDVALPEAEAPADRVFKDVEIAPPEAPEGPGESGAKAPAVPKAAADVPLAEKNPKPAVGTLVFDGLEYELNQDGETVTLVGFHGDAPRGDLVIPSRIKSGEDEYSVTRVEFRGGAYISLRLR